MPLIAYQGCHGSNDFPLHFSFFEILERRGVLARIDFVIDPFNDLEYSLALIARFPQLMLKTEESILERFGQELQGVLPHGGRVLSHLNRPFDGVCEGPGGRIHAEYLGDNDIFWRYPRTRRRAVVFHSIESEIPSYPRASASLASTDLVIARSSGSGLNAEKAGARNVVVSCDVVFGKNVTQESYNPGLAIALRIPDADLNNNSKLNIEEIFEYLRQLGLPVDFIKIEKPADIIQAGML